MSNDEKEGFEKVINMHVLHSELTTPKIVTSAASDDDSSSTEGRRSRCKVWVSSLHHDPVKAAEIDCRL